MSRAAKKAAAAPASTQPTHAFETLTPTQAEALLGKNEANRNLRPMKVSQYVRDMLNGEWKPYSLIQIDSNGKLIDGQHRLTAQVQAGVKIQWLVLRGVAPETQDVIDTGAPRSAADAIGFAGYKNSTQLAAAARLVKQYKMGALQGRRGESISMPEIMTTIEEEPILEHSVEIALGTKGHGSMTPIPNSILAVAHWMIAKSNGIEEADSFITRLLTLQGEASGSPVLALSRRANEIKRTQMRIKRKDWLALVIKAYNYDATGKAVNKIATYSKTGEFVNPEVQPRKSVPFLIGEDEEEVAARDAINDGEEED